MALWAQRILNKSSVHSDPDVYFILFTWMVEARVEWQMSIPVLTISVVWLKAIIFIKLYGLHSLMKRCKCIRREDTNKLNMYAVAR